MYSPGLYIVPFSPCANIPAFDFFLYGSNIQDSSWKVWIFSSAVQWRETKYVHFWKCNMISRSGPILIIFLVKIRTDYKFFAHIFKSIDPIFILLAFNSRDMMILCVLNLCFRSSPTNLWKQIFKKCLKKKLLYTWSGFVSLKM